MGSWYPPDLNSQHELLHKSMPCRAQTEIEGHLPLSFRFVLLFGFFLHGSSFSGLGWIVCE